MTGQGRDGGRSQHVENVIVDHCSNVVARNSYSLTLLSYCHYQNWTGWEERRGQRKVFLMTSIQPGERMGRLVTGMGERDIGLN